MFSAGFDSIKPLSRVVRTDVDSASATILADPGKHANKLDHPITII